MDVVLVKFWMTKDIVSSNPMDHINFHFVFSLTFHIKQSFLICCIIFLFMQPRRFLQLLLNLSKLCLQSAKLFQPNHSSKLCKEQTLSDAQSWMQKKKKPLNSWKFVCLYIVGMAMDTEHLLKVLNCCWWCSCLNQINIKPFRMNI